MCGVSLIDRVSSSVLREKVGVDVKMEDILVHGRLQWYGHVIRQDTNSQVREIMELEVDAKKPKRSSKESIGRMCKN